jgi:hypothetical protein
MVTTGREQGGRPSNGRVFGMRAPLLCLIGMGPVLVSFAFQARSAHACGGRSAAAPTAFPASGASEVSPYTSIIVAAGPSLPAGLSLEVGGQSVPLASILTLGSGLLGGGGEATFYRIPLYLSVSSSYTLSTTADNGARRELTHFTTAAGYDKTPGQAPVIDRLRLWRVHYPATAVGAGGCVFDEYEGYIDVDYQDGSVPNTPAGEVVTVLSLQPKTGSSVQRFVFAGLSHFDGAQIEDAPGTKLVDVPEGGLPSPIYALWKPTLEPDREYCVSMTLYGRNDQAMPAVTSNSACTTVTNLDARAGSYDAGIPTSDAATLDAGYPSVDGAGSYDTGIPASDAATLDAGYASMDSAGRSFDASLGGAAKKQSSGCSLGGGSPSTGIQVLWVLLLCALGRRRQRG